MNLSIFARYGRLGASSRLRFAQYLPFLSNCFSSIEMHALLDDRYLREFYFTRRRQHIHLISSYVRTAVDANLARGFAWIEKELLPYAPAWIERILLRHAGPVALDFDDAVFHTYDLHRWKGVRTLFGQKVDRLMARADLVTAGNDYLAERARAAGCGRVEIIPTVVDIERYPPVPRCETTHGSVPVVGWIGSPGSQRYLSEIAAPLARALRRGTVRCRFIGATEDAVLNECVEVVPWSEETEVKDIQGLDIGVMPLPNEPWAKGKCAYKLIQYMACGLPVVASPVGMNLDVVQHGVNGYLASSASEWEEAIECLAADANLRRRMGIAGRAMVEEKYCLQATGPRVSALFNELLA